MPASGWRSSVVAARVGGRGRRRRVGSAAARWRPAVRPSAAGLAVAALRRRLGGGLLGRLLRRPGARLRAAEDGRGAAGAATGTAAGADRDDLRVGRRRRARASQARPHPPAQEQARRRAAGLRARRRSRRRRSRSCTAARSRAPRASASCRRHGRRSGSRAARARSRRPLACRSTEPRRPTAKPGIGTVGLPRRRIACESISMPSPATLNVPATSETDGVPQHGEQVVLVQELQPRVEAEHARQHREPEVAGDRAHDVRADDVGRADRRDVDVGAPAGEAADVALDLVDVLGVSGARAAAWAPCPR